jgi:HTH-type transcriptional regulator, competence development regulator
MNSCPKPVKKVEQTFGDLIRTARQQKRHTQRSLGKLVSLDFGYLSRLENDRAEHPPSEEVVRGLAKALDLDAERLIYLVGRIPQAETELIRQNADDMQMLFRRMRSQPDYLKLMNQQFQEHSKKEEHP